MSIAHNLDTLDNKKDIWTVSYCSQMTQFMSDQELAELAVCSTGNNRKLDITGVLFFTGDRFVQVMEGERLTVQALFDRIKSDPRHERVTVLKDGPIPSRSFSGWAMRLVTLQFVSVALRETLMEALRLLAGDDKDGATETVDPIVRSCSSALVYGAMRTIPATLARQRAAAAPGAWAA